MKSPLYSVGFIEPEGMRNGSTTNERSTNTARITGNRLTQKSTKGPGCGSLPPAATAALRRRASHSLSSSQTTPVTRVRMVRTRLKPSTKLMSLNSLSVFLLALDAEHGEEGFLRDLHRADLLHALLAFLLLLQQLALARDVAAIAFGQHILAQRFHRGAGDDLGADGRLDGDVEHLPVDHFLHALGEVAAAGEAVVAVHDRGQRIDLVAVDQHVEPDQVGGLEAHELVLEA